MTAFETPFREMSEFPQMREQLQKSGRAISISGCVDSQKLHMVYGLSEGFRYKLLVTYSELRAKELYEDYQLYDRNVMLYPAKDLIFYQADVHGNRLTMERMKVLTGFWTGRPLPSAPHLRD